MLRNKVIKYWNSNPYLIIIVLAVFFRLLAAIFSKGYGMHDDHFDVIEVAQSWVDGQNFFNWLSNSIEENQSGRSFFYPGLHYFIFQTLEFFHISSPEIKMFVVRLLHAALSMLVVIYGYKITNKISGKPTANIVGLVLAAAWFMPFLSVRTLIETVTIGPMFLAIWYLIQKPTHAKIIFKYFIAGIIFGLCFCTRYQSILFSGSVIIWLLFSKNSKAFLFAVLGAILAVVLVSGLLEYAIWGHPFGKLIFYLKDNFGFFQNTVSSNLESYDLFGGLNYIAQIIGMFLPPLGIILFFSQFKVYKKYQFIILPSMVFLLFHILFPNRQERFVFTILPFVLMTGIAGFIELCKLGFWEKHKVLRKSFIIFALVLNTVLLFSFSTFYTKKSKIETMLHLSNENKIGNLIIETTPFRKSIALPGFYLNKKYPKTFYYTKETTLGNFQRDFDLAKINHGKTFILFLDSTRLPARLNRMDSLFSNLTFVYKSKASAIDKILYRLNSVNLNQDIWVYSCEEK